MRHLWTFLAMAAFLGAAELRGQVGGLSLGGTPAASRVKTEIAADTTALNGEPFMVAVTLTTHPAWHIYGSNPGDAGYATTFKWNVPQGFKVEPLAFPIPTAFVQPGDIHVLGYEGKTTFLFRIVPAAGKAAAGTATFSATPDWLCCNEAQCVPGKVTLDLSLSAGTAQATNKELFAQAMENIPAATPPSDMVAATGAPTAVEGAAETWQLQIGWLKRPQTVETFQPAVNGLDMSIESVTTAAGNPKSGPLAAADRRLAATSLVEFKAHVFAGQQVKAEKIPLLIAYTGADGKRKGFYLDVNSAAIGLRPK